MRQIGFAMAGVALAAVAAWWWRRHTTDEPIALPEVDAWTDPDLDELPPGSSAFESAPLSDRQLSAQPNTRVRRAMSGDDYGAIGVDDLGAPAQRWVPPLETERGVVLGDGGSSLGKQLQFLHRR